MAESSIGLNRTGCLWLNASSRRVRDAARWLAWAMRAMDSPADCVPRGLPPSKSVWPWMTVSRLLNSCAMPAARHPTASSFCACRNCASSFKRSVASCTITSRQGPASSVIGSAHRTVVADLAVAAPQLARPVADAIFGLAHFRWLRRPVIPEAQFTLRVQDELVRRIARELQEAGVGVQETAVGIVLNRHRHRAGQKGLRKALFGDAQCFLDARALFDLLLQFLRAFAHHPVQILHAQLRLAGQRPFPRQTRGPPAAPPPCQTAS